MIPAREACVPVLRAAGPRTCVFQLSGIVDLVDKITIENPYLTLAGQTAPGEGITIRGMLSLRTHDIIIRHIRVRPGPRLIPPPSNTDAIQITNSGQNIILDHVSMSWATDEVFSVIGSSAHDITIQWSIISESLDCVDAPFTHEKGCHGKGMLIGYAGTELSIHHNLIAHHEDRNPLFSSGAVDFVNNLIYNHKNFTNIKPKHGQISINVVANRYIAGINNLLKAPVRLRDGEPFNTGSGVFLQGNIDQLYRPDNSFPEDAVIKRKGDPPELEIVTLPFDYPPINTTDAFQAKADVLNKVGANNRLNADGTVTSVLGLVDTRILNDVLNGTGSVINMPSEVGGYPVIPSVMRPEAYDTDNDGMPDTWEGIHGLNSQTPSDGNQDADGDCYTNFEEFLNDTHPTDPDGMHPSLTITTPSEGDIVSGMVLINADVTSVEDIDRVEMYANGALIGASLSAPYSLLWDTTIMPEGPVALSAIAIDVNSQVGSTSIPITLNNMNDPP